MGVSRILVRGVKLQQSTQYYRLAGRRRDHIFIGEFGSLTDDVSAGEDEDITKAPGHN